MRNNNYNNQRFEDRPKRGLTVVVRNNDVNKAIRKLKKLMIADNPDIFFKRKIIIHTNIIVNPI